MKPKARRKHAVDMLMTLGLLACMGYALWGALIHEWLGTGMLILFFAHHILNPGWYRTVFRGRYTPARTLALCVNVLLLADMAALLYSGVLMSRHVFSFLPFRSGMALARKLHILGAYWGFVLMGPHLGLHWGMVKNHFRFLGKAGPWVGLAAAVYGGAAFGKRDMLSNLLLRNEFVFLDYGENPLRFCLDHTAMLGLFVFLGYWGSRSLRRPAGRKAGQ